MTDYQNNLEKILEILKDNPRGLNIREITEFIGVSRVSSAKYLDVLVAEGKIEVRTMGKAKVFYIIQISTPSSLLNRIPSMILILNTDVHVIQANDHFLKYCSLSPKQVFGHPLDTIPRGVTREPAFLKALDEVIRTGNPQADFLIDVHSEEKQFRVTIKPTYHSDDRFGILVIMNDITGPKGNVAEKPGSTDDRLPMLLEDIGIPACVVQAGKIRLMNARFVDMTGYNREDLVSRPFIEFVNAEDRETVRVRHDEQIPLKKLNQPCLFRGLVKPGVVPGFDGQSIPIVWKREPAALIICYQSSERMNREYAE